MDHKTVGRFFEIHCSTDKALENAQQLQPTWVNRLVSSCSWRPSSTGFMPRNSLAQGHYSQHM